MKGNLTARVKKGDEEIERVLDGDREYLAPDGSKLSLHGRSLMFVRNVGTHMYTDAVTTADGEEIPEGRHIRHNLVGTDPGGTTALPNCHGPGGLWTISLQTGSLNIWIQFPARRNRYFTSVVTAELATAPTTEP